MEGKYKSKEDWREWRENINIIKTGENGGKILISGRLERMEGKYKYKEDFREWRENIKLGNIGENGGKKINLRKSGENGGKI